MATINEALKKLFLGLGGDPDELKDNNTVSDYIDDLESAIETAASGASEELIDDEAASTTKTYSSSKIASLIPENELPTPAAADIGKVVSVVSDGDEGAEYALETPSSGGGDDLKIERVISVSGHEGDTPQITFIGGVTRQDILDYVTAEMTTQAQKANISAYIYYGSSDYSISVSCDLFLNELFCYSNNKHLPVFTGIVPALGAGSATSGDLYRVIFILGETAADDRLEVIKLTTT